MGFFHNEFKYCADHYFNIQCFISCKKVIYIDKVIAIFNNEGRSSSLTDDTFQKKRTLLIIEKYENPIEVYDKFLRFDKQQIKLCKDIIDYKIGHLMLSPLRLMLKITSKLFKG
jgi:hypothetical protein